MPSTLSLDEVAALLNRRPSTFRAKWRGLVNAYGFPRPLPGCGLVWSRALVEAWIDGGGIPPAAPDAHGAQPGLPATIERQRQLLRARYAPGDAA